MGQQNISSCLFFSFFFLNQISGPKLIRVPFYISAFPTSVTSPILYMVLLLVGFHSVFCFVFLRKKKKALKSLQGETLCLLLRLCTRNTHRFALEANPMN